MDSSEAKMTAARIFELNGLLSPDAPLKGEIVSNGIDSCIDVKTGASIDVLFSGEDWGMPIPMPDPAKVSEFDPRFGARFITLHELVQLKTAVYLAKLAEEGEDVASKDRSDVFELIRNRLSEFSEQVIHKYHPALRMHCLRAYQSAQRAGRARPPK